MQGDGGGSRYFLTTDLKYLGSNDYFFPLSLKILCINNGYAVGPGTSNPPESSYFIRINSCK